MEAEDGDSWNHTQNSAHSTLVYDSVMTGRISKQLCTSGMPSGDLNETWELGETFETFMAKLLLLVHILWRKVFVEHI
jgi:hypothetical protein